MTRPRKSAPPSAALVAAVLLAVAAYAVWSGRQAPAEAPVESAARAPAVAPAAVAPTSPAVAVPPSRDSLVMRDQRIVDEQGRVIYEGDVDLGPVFARIAAGERDSHRNDGTTFGNREGRLPRQPRGYYTEWVVRTDGLRSVGPQRLITGRGGEAYYTPDHYETFVPVRPPS